MKKDVKELPIRGVLKMHNDRKDKLTGMQLTFVCLRASSGVPSVSMYRVQQGRHDAHTSQHEASEEPSVSGSTTAPSRSEWDMFGACFLMLSLMRC